MRAGVFYEPERSHLTAILTGAPSKVVNLPSLIRVRLEQLRVLHHGYRIRVAEACASAGLGIDTPADLDRARRRAASRN